MAGVIVARDGAIVTRSAEEAAEAAGEDLRTPAGFLRWLGDGAYTAARVDLDPEESKAAIPFWDQHVARLAESLRLLAVSVGASTPSASCSDVVRAIDPSVRAALTALTFPSGGAPRSVSAMLTVALVPPRGACVIHALPMDRAPPPPPAVLFLSPHRRANPRAKAVRWARDRRPLEATLHTFSGGKDVPRPTEVLMTTPGGDALEGLKCNFFAVFRQPQQQKQPVKGTAQGTGLGEGEASVGLGDGTAPMADAIEVRTASIDAGVLPGIARAAALEALRGMGLPVVEAEEGVAMDAIMGGGGEASSCVEAFTTSGVRMVQPVRAIVTADGRPVILPPFLTRGEGEGVREPREGAAAMGPVTARVCEAVSRLARDRARSWVVRASAF